MTGCREGTIIKSSTDMCTTDGILMDEKEVKRCQLN